MRVATADRRRVEQIVTNLGANALKFTPSGGNVEIVGRFDGVVAIIAVRDDGPGIPADDRSRIFERFHRMAGHERITGTGLGLPIARDLARQMGGDICPRKVQPEDRQRDGNRHRGHREAELRSRMSLAQLPAVMNEQRNE